LCCNLLRPPCPRCSATTTILLRLGLPTSLLRASLVCRRWYGHVFDPAFLRRFRDRHPPRVLGVYLKASDGPLKRFFPIRPLPELAAAVRRVGSFFDSFAFSSTFVEDSRGSRLLVTTIEDEKGGYKRTHLLCSPQSPAGNAVVVPQQPPVPRPFSTEPVNFDYYMCLPDGGDGRSYFWVVMEYREQQTTVRLYELQDMCWVARASLATQIPITPPRHKVLQRGFSKNPPRYGPLEKATPVSILIQLGFVSTHFVSCFAP
ncbi:hypothetical protein EJB05_54450, partial [Eragrostis curvula]